MRRMRRRISNPPPLSRAKSALDLGRQGAAREGLEPGLPRAYSLAAVSGLGPCASWPPSGEGMACTLASKGRVSFGSGSTTSDSESESDDAPPPPPPRHPPPLPADAFDTGSVDARIAAGVCDWLFSPTGGGLELRVRVSSRHATEGWSTTELAYGDGVPLARGGVSRALHAGTCAGVVLPALSPGFKLAVSVSIDRKHHYESTRIRSYGSVLLAASAMPAYTSVSLAYELEAGDRIVMHVNAPVQIPPPHGGTLLDIHSIDADVDWPSLCTQLGASVALVASGALACGAARFPRDARITQGEVEAVVARILLPGAP
jgi:hypothetical protein